MELPEKVPAAVPPSQVSRAVCVPVFCVPVPEY